ncbi:MAG TPA: EF-P lysine aminoacylase EpmA [Acidiferrobacter sp.]|nr:EF-P lysine aminoacylase EpmA [Acidiferrobacter sp.]
MSPDGNWQPQASLATLRLRAALLAEAREFFARRGFLEVETPILAHAGAADAQLAQFALDDPIHGPLFLQTSPEYAMKRLLLAGSGSIYQVTKAFRQGEAGARHNPEFTLIEWYGLGYDHKRLIDEACALIRELVPRLVADTRITRFRDAFRHVIGVDPIDDPTSALCAAADTLIPSASALALTDRDEILDLLMCQAVAPGFPDDRLTVITDYPASQAALARVNTRGLADRFEIYCGAIELANGFHEAATHAEYARRFAAEKQKRRDRGLPPIPTDERLLAALDQNPLPDCAGVAMGFDRVLMLAIRAAHISETITFAIDRA